MEEYLKEHPDHERKPKRILVALQHCDEILELRVAFTKHTLKNDLDKIRGIK